MIRVRRVLKGVCGRSCEGRVQVGDVQISGVALSGWLL